MLLFVFALLFGQAGNAWEMGFDYNGTTPNALCRQTPCPGCQCSDITIRLRDLTGAGVAGATMLLLDTNGTLIARATSDATGQVAFDPPGFARVRVAVAGHLADGTALRLAASDQPGILIEISDPAPLELRSEPNGLVLPDPQTMIAVAPLVSEATPQPAPLVLMAPAVATTVPDAFGLLLVAALLVTLVLALGLARHWRHG